MASTIIADLKLRGKVRCHTPLVEKLKITLALALSLNLSLFLLLLRFSASRAAFISLCGTPIRLRIV